MKSNEDVSESAKNYEKNKRQQVFQNSWKQGRTWLVCEDNAMFCSVCKEAAALVFFPLSQRSVEGHGAFIQVFHFNLEESKGHFILGQATKNSSKLGRLATKRWS